MGKESVNDFEDCWAENLECEGTRKYFMCLLLSCHNDWRLVQYCLDISSGQMVIHTSSYLPLNIRTLCPRRNAKIGSFEDHQFMSFTVN